MHLIDYILIAALIVAVVFAVRHIRKKKRGSCCGDCASCGRYCDHRENENRQH